MKILDFIWLQGILLSMHQHHKCGAKMRRRKQRRRRRIRLLREQKPNFSLSKPTGVMLRGNPILSNSAEMPPCVHGFCSKQQLGFGNGIRVVGHWFVYYCMIYYYTMLLCVLFHISSNKLYSCFWQLSTQLRWATRKHGGWLRWLISRSKTPLGLPLCPSMLRSTATMFHWLAQKLMLICPRLCKKCSWPKLAIEFKTTH